MRHTQFSIFSLARPSQKVAGPKEEKKDGIGFGVSLKKVNQKKEGKDGALELPKLKKISKGGKEEDTNNKPGFKLKKISRGDGITLFDSFF